ncbi:MAG: glycoside hydrolase family 5 protein [Dysgonamonadaceae bacterium]|jgi:endoglucanase|nr:glycoside hydrolase family 5 protein [Dysgonamonadaceae bacterium]
MKKVLSGSVIALIISVLFSVSMKAEDKDFSISKGVNISHWLSQSNVRGERRAAYFTRDDVEFIVSVGFDHIRFPIDEEQMFDTKGNKNKEAFALLHNALGWCAEFGLKAVVDLHILRSHNFNAAVKPLFTEEAAQERFYDCWRKISGELKKYPLSMVAYELMNEPVADDPEQWNVIVNRCAAVVRKLEPERTLVIGSNRWQSYDTVKDLKVPDNDKHIIISFHYYNPFLLTHYLAPWTDNRNYHGPVHYPGKLIADEDLAKLTPAEKENFGWANSQVYNLEKIESDFREVLQMANSKGLKVYCGEYGCIDNAPADDAVRWFTDMNTAFYELGIARAIWDYKEEFGIIKKGVVQEDIIEAILGD